MIIFLVKGTVAEYQTSEAIFEYYESGAWHTYTTSFLGTLSDLLDDIFLNTGILFKGLYDTEYMTIDLSSSSATIVKMLDNDFTRQLGFRNTTYSINATASYWGTHRFMINNDDLLGHEANNMRPYEIESNFTLDGRVYKSTPGISTIFYEVKFGDYTKKQVERGVIPFVENLESNIDLKFTQEAYDFFGGFFNTDTFQISFDKKYLEAGLTLNANIVKCQISERPSSNFGGRTLYYLTDSLGNFIITSNGAFITLER